MNYSRIVKKFLPVVCAIMLVVQMPVDTRAEPYISFNGRFKIDIPDDWSRMDYRTVDYYLSQTAESPEDMQYEAVFAPDRDAVVFQNEYLMLTLDTLGRQSRDQIDSTAREIAESFEVALKSHPLGKLEDLKSDSAVYDHRRKQVTVLTDIWEGGEIIQRNLLVVQFYDKGVASFFFYAPDSLYESLTETFSLIVNSFSTENLEPQSGQSVEVADLKKTDDFGLFTYIGIGLFLLTVLAALIALRRKMRTD